VRKKCRVSSVEWEGILIVCLVCFRWLNVINNEIVPWQYFH